MLSVESVVTVGQAGAWIGPLLVGVLAALLDASAVGSHAIRDRIAVVGYYASFLSFVYLLGLSGWERTAFSDYNWRMAGAAGSLVAHGALLIAMFGPILGPTRKLSKSITSSWVKIGGAESAATKINQSLLGWTLAAAVTAPLSGSQGWGVVVDAVGQASTQASAAVAGMVLRWIGG